MEQTSEQSLGFVVHHLRWSLDQPLVYGERDWAARVGRALDRLAAAFERHVEHCEGPDGWFSRVADPGLLPFTAEAHHVERLREQHQGLQTRLRGVAAQFRDALLLFPPHLDTSLSDPAADDLQEVRAFRLFGVLDPCVGDLLAELDAHLATEEAVIRGAPPGGQLPSASRAMARLRSSAGAEGVLAPAPGSDVRGGSL